MSVCVRPLAFAALLGLLPGCAMGPAGLAISGASMLASALTGGASGAGGAGPRRLTIDPNKGLSEQLAQVQRGASPACRATLAKLEARGSAAPADPPPPSLAESEALPPPAQAPGGASEGSGEAEAAPAARTVMEERGTEPASRAAGEPRGGTGPDCAVRPLCLAGAEAPIPMMVCTRDTAGGPTLAHLSPAPMELPKTPIDEVTPRRDALPDSPPGSAAPPPAGANDAWRWAATPGS